MEKWEVVQAVRRMHNYIRAHIREPITLVQLARAAGYSPFHASRLFEKLTGKAPFEYIRELRLSAAADMLEPGVRVIDVALDFTFGSHEGFTRAFTKHFGLSPKEYRAKAPHPARFLLEDSGSYYLKLQKGDGNMKKNLNTVFVQVADRPARKLILKRGVKATHYYEYCEEAGCDVWEELSKIKEALYEPIGLWLPEAMVLPGTSVYAQGVEVPADFAGEIPEGFDVIDLPPCKMLVFQGPPFDDSKFEDAISDIWEIMKNYDPSLYGFKWADDDAPRFQLSPMGYRGYIEARPVQPINE